MTDIGPADQAPWKAFGRYKLLGLIGRGGMAEVYKAKSFGVEGFEKQLVIKRILPELASNSSFVEMFIREAKLAVRLSHGNIVQVFDLGRMDHEQSAASYFIAMEWVPGVDLASVIKRYRRKREQLPLGFASYIAGEVAKALDHAHRRSDEYGTPLHIVHRDISPQNILLSWDGDVKVTDFGIAKAAESIQPSSNKVDGSGHTAGKTSFMSPEQASGEDCDARSDLFSLGSVIYEIIAGDNPFRAPSEAETIRRIRAGEYPPLSLSRPDLPKALTDIVDRLLAPNREERMGSAAELSEVLLGYAYTSGERFGASELATMLRHVRDSIGSTEGDVPRTSWENLFEEPNSADEKTPIEIPHGSTPPPKSMPEPSLGERREVTAMVVSLPSSREPRSDAAHGQQLVEHIRSSLERHGAWIDSHTNKQLVAIFGLGATDGRDADAAVSAALLLVRERSLGTVSAIGIHSGPISVDDGGIPIQDQRLANLLRDAEGLARSVDGEVALSPTTGRLVRRSFVTEPIPPSPNRLREGLIVRRTLQSETQLGKFVGRQKELKKLGTIIASATRNKPQIAVIRGETGVGKTRLLDETRRRLRRGHFKVACYATNCPLNGATEPWSGLRAMWHVLCGTSHDDDPQRILEVQPRLRALGLHEEQAKAVLSLLGAQTTAPNDFRSLLRSSFVKTVTSLCKDRLHCFFWDNAEALDAETLDALIRVMKRQRVLRGVFILSLRNEPPPALAELNELHTLVVKELNQEHTALLVERQLGARSVPESLLSYVRDCAGGHPLFVEELLRELCDSGVVQVLSGAVSLAEDVRPTAPRTLRTLIADRVSRLQQRERGVLRGIAILKEPAFTPILAATLKQRLPSLDRHLSGLEQHGLIRRAGATQVRFASPLFQEIVLDIMPARTRQELHVAAANVYKTDSGHAPDETAERIAEHLLGASKKNEAADYFWESALERSKIGQSEIALRSMLRAFDLADCDEREVGQLTEWLKAAANLASRVRRGPGLREAFAKLLKQVETRGEKTQIALAKIQTARALGAVNHFDEAYEELAGVDISAEQDPDGTLRVAAWTSEMELCARQGLFTRGAAAAKRLEESGLALSTDARLMLAGTKASIGNTAEALALVDELDEQAPPSNDVGAALRMKHRFLIHFNDRDFVAACKVSSALAKLAQKAGLRFEAAAALHNLGDACDRIGDHPRAYAAFVESLDLCREMELERLINLNQMHLALLDGLRNFEGADERIITHIRHADARGYLWDVLEGKFLLARLMLRHGDHVRAKKYLREVLDLSEEHRHELLRLDALELMSHFEDS
jgi:eukaryotic-like serine/threonine-protein kinase